MVFFFFEISLDICYKITSNPFLCCLRYIFLVFDVPVSDFYFVPIMYREV